MPSTVKPSSKPLPSKPLPSKPLSRKPSSRRSRASASISTPAPVAIPSIPEDGDVVMKDGINGHSGPVLHVARGSRKRSRLSRTGTEKHSIPQPPLPFQPHQALFIFGTGDMGQIGLGPDQLDEIPRPKLHTWFEAQIEGGKLSGDRRSGSGGFETVACGGMHTLAVDEGGRVWSWGINDNASLGRITADVPDPSNPPNTIPNEDLETVPHVLDSVTLDGFRAVQVAAGDSVSIAVSDKGQLRAWGSFRSNDGVLGFNGIPGDSPFQFHPIAVSSLEKAKVEVVSASCGENHVLALATTGEVYSWGTGQQSQLGRRIMERRKLNGLIPEKVGLKDIVLASAGMYHSFAIDSYATVWAWGLNTFHQLGLSNARGGNQDMVGAPAQVDSLSPEKHGGARVVQIEGGEHHSVFLFDNGEVWGCGRCDAHQLGLAEDHPAFDGIRERRMAVMTSKQEKVDAAQRTLNAAEDAAAKEEAETDLSAAQASLHAALDEFVPEPVRICFPPIPQSYEVVPPFPPYAQSRPSDNPIRNISAGTRHNLAVSKSGHVYSWGLGIQAQLGLGSEESAEVPTLVRSKSLRPYTALSASAGGQHCVLLAQLTEAPDGMEVDG